MIVPQKNIIDFEEIGELTAFINEHFGFDFSSYCPSSLQRRLERLMVLKKIHSVEAFKNAVNNGQFSQSEIISQISINVTEMFRDPACFRELASTVIPGLSSLPSYKIWSAGCSSGEEMYSLAILFYEYNLSNKSIFYGTDISTAMIAKAKQGAYDAAVMKLYSDNYLKAGGKFSLGHYCAVQDNKFIINSSLREKMVFAIHNLASDFSFNEFHLIVCRNVLIYFDRQLKERALNLLIDSLAPGGYLVLGNKETAFFSGAMKYLYVVNSREKIYRKKI
jgi:chemotaxis protein methyltransferase CheR